MGNAEGRRGEQGGQEGRERGRQGRARSALPALPRLLAAAGSLLAVSRPNDRVAPPPSPPMYDV